MMCQEKEAAIKRIKRTPELSRLLHLAKVQWRDCSSFWNWIAAAPFTDILDTVCDLTPSSLRRIAYHEAGHAVAGYLTYVNVRSASIIPAIDGPSAGEVCIESDFVRSISTSAYLAWRAVVQWLAGPAAEDRLLKTVLDGFDPDIAKAISYIRLVEGLLSPKNFLLSALVGVVALFSNKTVWNAVDEIAKLLLKHGKIYEEEISAVVENKVLKAVNIVIDRARLYQS